MIKNILVESLCLLFAFIVYTHTEYAIESNYFNYMNTGCSETSDHDLCMLGASVIKTRITSCMKKSIFPTLRSTFFKCFKEAVENQ